MATFAAIAGFAISGLSAIGFSRLALATNHWLQANMAAEVENMVRASSQGRTDAALVFWTSDIRGSLPPQDIADFGQQVSARYGRMQRFSIMSTSKPGSFFDTEMDVSGVFVFDNGQLLGSASFKLRPVIGQSMPELQLRSLVIEDHEKGILQLPHALAGKP